MGSERTAASMPRVSQVTSTPPRPSYPDAPRVDVVDECAKTCEPLQVLRRRRLSRVERLARIAQVLPTLANDWQQRTDFRNRVVKQRPLFAASRQSNLTVLAVHGDAFAEYGFQNRSCHRPRARSPKAAMPPRAFWIIWIFDGCQLMIDSRPSEKFSDGLYFIWRLKYSK